MMPNKEMRILLITGYFPPEVGSASHLFYDLGREFARRGHQTTVLTGYPSYHVDKAHVCGRYGRGMWMTEEMDGIRVVRVRVPRMPRNIPVLRGLEQVMMSIAFTLRGLITVSRKAEVILIYSPPLFLGLTGLTIKLFRGSRVILNVQDLFPQSAIDLGLMQGRILISFFRRMESFLYHQVDLVVAHSPGNQEHVLRSGAAPAKAVVVHNHVDTAAITPGPRENEFRAIHGVSPAQFLVSFAGVLGYSQDLDTVIGAASMLRDRPEIVFYIVGDGVEKPRLMQEAKGAPNVKFLPMLPKDEYASLLRASDVCLVTLRADVKTPVVPSKILSIMASGRPLVAGVPLEGDAPLIIREGKCGLCVEPESPKALAEAIRDLQENPDRAAAFGLNGRRYVEQHFALTGIVDIYERLFSAKKGVL